jgi:CBS domain-containing protein
MDSRYKVSDIMTRKPVIVSMGTSVKDACNAMKNQKVGSLIVVEKGKLKGLLTEKDIVFKVASTDAKASDFNVEDIMTSVDDIITTSSTQGIDIAILLMKDNDVRRLPVVDGEELVGIITSKDILKIEPALFEHVYDMLDLKEHDRKLQFLNR